MLHSASMLALTTGPHNRTDAPRSDMEGMTMQEPDVIALLEPVAASCGMEIDRVEILSAGKRQVLRIFVDGDGPNGRGPSLDDIAAVTHAISAALDAWPAAGSQPYTLEVSSRGVNRPLTASKHFRRNTGRLVAVTLTGGGAFTGRILAVDGDVVTFDVDGVTRAVPTADIAKALVQVEMNRSLGADDDLDVDDLVDDDTLDEEE